MQGMQSAGCCRQAGAAHHLSCRGAKGSPRTKDLKFKHIIKHIKNYSPNPKMTSFDFVPFLPVSSQFSLKVPFLLDANALLWRRRFWQRRLCKSGALFGWDLYFFQQLLKQRKQVEQKSWKNQGERNKAMLFLNMRSDAALNSDFGVQSADSWQVQHFWKLTCRTVLPRATKSAQQVQYFFASWWKMCEQNKQTFGERAFLGLTVQLDNFAAGTGCRTPCGADFAATV